MLTADSRRRRLLLMGMSEPGRAAPDERGAFGPAGEDESAGRFFQECGGEPPLKLAVTGPDRHDAAEFGFERPFMLIGRGPFCDLHLQHPEVSRRHAYLQVVDGSVLICDLASGTGTFWEDEHRQAGWLSADHRLGIGPYRLWLPEDGLESVPRPTLPTMPDEPGSDRPAPCLQFLTGAGDLHNWHVDRDVTLIGTARRCKLRLLGKAVSKVHASLVRTDCGLWVIDLTGEGGTLLDREPVEFALLKDGQELQIGGFHIGIDYQQARSTGGPTRRRKRGTSRSARPSATTMAAAATGTHAVSEERHVQRTEQTQENQSPAEGRVSEQFVTSLMQHFADWQQQMLKQTQETTQSLVRLATAIHESNRELVRHILDRDQNRTLRGPSSRQQSGPGPPRDEPRPPDENPADCGMPSDNGTAPESPRGTGEWSEPTQPIPCDSAGRPTSETDLNAASAPDAWSGRDNPLEHDDAAAVAAMEPGPPENDGSGNRSTGESAPRGRSVQTPSPDTAQHEFCDPLEQQPLEELLSSPAAPLWKRMLEAVARNV